jgi:hypothetical protein
MEEEKTRNMVEHEDEIQARPKKTWFQSKDEKRAAREGRVDPHTLVA